jgi:cell wall-associated NlpC family hydrolase
VNDGRKRCARVLATLCITALGGSLLAVAPTYAEPDIDTVQQRVDTLYHQAEQASERYNDARLDLTHARTRLSALRADLDRQKSKVDSVRERVATAVVAEYQGQALGATTQVLLADDPDAFLDRLGAVSEYNDQQARMMGDLAVQAGRLEMRETAARRELDRIASTEKALRAEKVRIDERSSEAKRLLARLQDEAAAERAAAASRSARRLQQAAPLTAAAAPAPAAPAPAAPAASGRAGAAVAYALAQVGDAYVYGAAGPSAFDCSGLTMMAWAQAGVGLPHSSTAQMSSGSPVSQSALQPGDLVFYYSPVSHVGMYIGNGMIVHAANPSSGVTTAPVNSMPYSGAVRPG